MKGLNCLIVGAGKIASRKAQKLTQAGASVTILSPEIKNDWLATEVSKGNIPYIQSDYNSDILADYDLIVSATFDPELNIKIGRHAELLRKLWCVVSSARSSRVIFPAVYNNNALTIAVHSNGTNCQLSKKTRDNITQLLQDKNILRKNFALFGFKKTDLPGSASRALSHLTNQIEANKFGDEILMLSTCQRWECYIYNTAPRNTIRHIIEVLKRETNFEWDEICLKSYLLYNNAAYYNLVRIVAGLDSPMIGETEIVGQANSLLQKMRGAKNSDLCEIFESAMLAGRKLRKSCSLKPPQQSWAQAAVSFIQNRFSGRTNINILLVGMGKLACSISSLLWQDHKLNIFSSRPQSKVKQHGKSYGNIYELKEITRFIKKTDIIILCTEMPQHHFDIQICDLPQKLLVIDFEGNNEFIQSYRRRVEYFKANDIINTTLNGNMAASIASAELKVLEQSLFRHRIYSGNKSAFFEKLVIGTRQSSLALKQVDEIKTMLETLAPDIQCSVKKIDTPCDRDRLTPLPSVIDDDFFTRDIDKALLEGSIDIAVHSAKDMPQKTHPKLYAAVVTPSISPWECLISKSGLSLSELPAGAIIGTSSQRRRDQLKKLRPDLIAADVRGNVPERIKQLDDGKYDALILAAAGLIRLGMQERITELFSEHTFPSAPGQGSLAIVVRESDKELREFLRPLDLGKKDGLPWL